MKTEIYTSQSTLKPAEAFALTSQTINPTQQHRSPLELTREQYQHQLLALKQRLGVRN